MKEPRHVVEKKGRYLVPIPAGVREHLGVVKGAQVWWHTVKKGEAALTVNGQRARGAQRLDADCPSCAAFRQESVRLRTMLRATTAVDYNTAFNQGVHQGLKIGPYWLAELEQLHAESRELRGLLASLVVRLGGAPPRRRHPARSPATRPAPAGPVVVPAPVLEEPGPSALLNGPQCNLAEPWQTPPA